MKVMKTKVFTLFEKCTAVTNLTPKPNLTYHKIMQRKMSTCPEKKELILLTLDKK